MTRFAPGAHCPDCYRPLRRRKDPPSGNPNEVVHGGRGLCAGCYRARHRFKTLERVEPTGIEPTWGAGRPKRIVEDEPDLRVDETAAEIVAYIRARRARGIPNDASLAGIPLLKELEA